MNPGSPGWKESWGRAVKRRPCVCSLTSWCRRKGRRIGRRDPAKDDRPKSTLTRAGCQRYVRFSSGRPRLKKRSPHPHTSHPKRLRCSRTRRRSSRPLRRPDASPPKIRRRSLTCASSRRTGSLIEVGVMKAKTNNDGASPHWCFNVHGNPTRLIFSRFTKKISASAR